MSEGPNVKGNPIRVVAVLLILSYVLGEFLVPKYHILYAMNIWPRTRFLLLRCNKFAIVRAEIPLGTGETRL